MRKATATVSSNRDMNELVDFICDQTGKGTKDMRDKFKMLDRPNSKTVLELCKFLKLNVLFTNNSKVKEISVFLPNLPVERKTKKAKDELEDILDAPVITQEEINDVEELLDDEFKSVSDNKEEEDDNPFD